MAGYDRLPTYDTDTHSQTQTSFFHQTHLILPNLTRVFRARASSILSDSSTSSNNSLHPSRSPSPSFVIRSSPGFWQKTISRGKAIISYACHSRQQYYVRLLRLVWCIALFAGEYGSFWVMVHRCSWPENSSWDTDDAALEERYRIAVIADPQLTDWLSYHQSGILLTLVETYTDIFMKRSFHRLHASLRPDAVIFVGDLNDGGRLSKGEVFEKNKHRFMDRVFESKSSAWNQQPVFVDAADTQQSPSEPRVSKRQYNDPPPDEEHINITGRYQQMMDIPQSASERAAMRNAGKSVRLFVAGNHDVGFGDTLIRSSMNRYKQVWGSVNYEVQMGNHSLVVLDTLALSSGTQSIREESQLFLSKLAQENQTYPTILFTHVPLFRPDITFCGDKREHKRGIINRKGRQYQNMVSTELSDEILRGIRPDMIFSGDDHDWCEIAHPFDGSVTPEVSVPTFSFAQGIRQPAFMMLSLYNPEQKTKNVYPMVSASSGLPVSTEDSVNSVMRPSGDATFAYEECMLPDQLAIYLCYGVLLAMTLNWILIARYRWMTRVRRMLSQRSILVQWNDSSHGSTTATAPLLQSLAQQQQQPQQQRNGEYTDETIHPLSDTASLKESLSIEEASLKAKRNLWPLRSGLYWKVIARDVWSIAIYAIPFYAFLFITSIL